MTAGLRNLVAGKSYAVLGLGRTGTATAQALHEAGAHVVAWDDGNRPEASDFDIRPLAELDISAFDAVLMSPGIPHTFPKPHPVALLAKQAKVPLIGDIEILMRAQADLPESERRKFVGITGTNGKSTTTELVAHILRENKIPFSVGGNLGPAALGLEDPGAGGWYVLEMSSYQLELLHKAEFDISAFLNLTPDHLERHGGVEGYIEAKAQIFEQLRDEGKAVISVDQKVGKDFSEKYAQNLVSVSVENAADVSALSGALQSDGFAFDLTQLDKFPGKHNWQNFAIAFAVTREMGLTPDDIVSAMKTFGGLAHRQEYVGELAGVTFVNDSKGTNPEASEVALKAYENIYWIVGGQAKAEGIRPLLPYLNKVKKVFLIGESADEFAGTLAGKVAFEISRDLSIATRHAFEQAQKDQGSGSKNTADLHNPVILLSPACASFDQFPSFEVRGEAFKAEFKTLAKT